MTARAPSASSAGVATAGVSRSTLGLVVLAVLGLCAGYVLTRPEASPALVAASGAMLALGVPGLACSRALFPGGGMGRAERVALAVGIQCSLVVVCGFLLHLLRPGLSAPSWGALLGDITLMACLVAWIRGRAAEARVGPDAPSRSAPASSWSTRALAAATRRQLVMLGGAGLLVLLAMGIARVGESAQPQPAWTALAVVPAVGGRAVTVDISNAEGRDETYRIVVNVDGVQLTTLGPVAVPGGDDVRLDVSLPEAGAFLRRVTVDLWRADDPASGQPYRSVALSIRGAVAP